MAVGAETSQPLLPSICLCLLVAMRMHAHDQLSKVGPVAFLRTLAVPSR